MAQSSAGPRVFPGIRIDQFEVIRELGQGGMGRVFLARDTKLARLVALKLLRAESEGRIEKFLLEARATARCQHEHIVVIHDAGEWQGHPYLVLEYLEGAPLSALVAGHPLSQQRALELILPVLRALMRAHELGIVHRDLKPENIFVTRTGLVKVLDFGIAKLDASAPGGVPGELSVGDWTPHSEAASGVGTIAYMAPEQWRGEEVDPRTDIWAIGVTLWQMLTDQHPLGARSVAELRDTVSRLHLQMPALASARADLPAELCAIVDRCMQKDKAQRFASVRELVSALEPFLPLHHARALSDGDNPYPGMRAFQENDADRFFGRERDVQHLLTRVQSEPLVALVGASGVGKSSLVRAGLIPALRRAAERWEIITTRPGRNPLASLAALLDVQLLSTDECLTDDGREASLTARLRNQPGTLGTLLRERARTRQGRILLFVDQFEELYTLVSDPDERRAYTDCLLGVADHGSTPLRVVLSMRSDFVDRVAEHRPFLERLSPQLHFLGPITREGLRRALVEPLELSGHAFASDELVAEMLDTVEETTSSLPLLQFTAAKLWDARDRKRRLLTVESYRELGGVVGALSAHADEVLAPLSTERRGLIRKLFMELVTPDGTRALAQLSELRRLAEDPGELDRVLADLTAARLLVVHAREECGPAVEIVHESLISSWSTLRRWREEGTEGAAFLSQLRAAARQWDERGRATGLLWRGEAVDELRRFHGRYQGELAARERDYASAVLELSERSARRMRRMIIAAFAALTALMLAAAGTTIWVRRAERIAHEQKLAAQHAAERSRIAEARVKQQLETIQQKERERELALRVAREAEEQARSGKEKLALTYEQLASALENAERARAEAQHEQKRAERQAHEIEKLAEAERASKRRVEQLLAAERVRVEELEREQRRLSSKLK